MVMESWGRCQLWIDRTVRIDLDHKPTSKRNLGETLNTKILEDFTTFLTVGRTQDFDFG
jgi:hypothetical protein